MGSSSHLSVVYGQSIVPGDPRCKSIEAERQKSWVFWMNQEFNGLFGREGFKCAAASRSNDMNQSMDFDVTWGDVFPL